MQQPMHQHSLYTYSILCFEYVTLSWDDGESQTQIHELKVMFSLCDLTYTVYYQLLYETVFE